MYKDKKLLVIKLNNTLTTIKKSQNKKFFSVAFSKRLDSRQNHQVNSRSIENQHRVCFRFVELLKNLKIMSMTLTINKDIEK